MLCPPPYNQESIHEGLWAQADSQWLLSLLGGHLGSIRGSHPCPGIRTTAGTTVGSRAPAHAARKRRSGRQGIPVPATCAAPPPPPSVAPGAVASTLEPRRKVTP